MSVAKPIRRPPPLDVIRRAKARGIRQVIVSLSCGKDAAVTLDLCMQHFDEVRAFFMYLVPGLSFQESYLRYHERRYDIQIMRIPHWMLGRLYRYSSFRHPTKGTRKTRNVRISDIDAYVRQETGIEWVATGERCADSLERNAQIKSENGINEKRRRIWPIGFWPNGAVFNYLRTREIAMPADYGAGVNFSFGSLWHRELKPIADRFPDDFRKICQHFPLIPAQMKRYELREKQAKKQRSEQRSKQARQGQ